MLGWNPEGDYPEIDKTSHVHATAVIIGKVRIGKNVFIGPGAVIRADEPKSSVTVGNNCNIQDRVVIHALGGSVVEIGEKSSLSHGCIVHGPCVIGKGCFVGFGSVVFKACLGEGVFVRFLAVVSGVDISQGRIIKDGAIINTKQRAKALKAKTKGSKDFARRVIKANSELLIGYRQEV